MRDLLIAGNTEHLIRFRYHQVILFQIANYLDAVFSITCKAKLENLLPITRIKGVLLNVHDSMSSL